jgi:spore coat protein H
VKFLFLFLLFISTICRAQIPRYNITISKAVEESLRTRDTFSDDYLPAQFGCNDTVWNDVKIRYKGHSTRYFSKKPFRVRFPKKRLFDGIEDLNLNSMYTDKSFLREKLAWDLFEEIGELAPRARYAHLSLNGRSQGLYLVVDKVDKYFLRNRGRNVSSVYDAGAYYSLADMTVQNKQLLPLYYPKAVGNKDDYDELSDLFSALNAGPDSTFPTVADSLFDMNSVYNWFAGNILMMMGDSYNKNYLLYRDDSRRLHQWVVVPWDYDISFGTTGDLMVPYPQSLLNQGFSYTFPPLSGPTNILKERMMRSEAMREHLRLRVDTLLNSVFTNQHLDPFIDSMASMIKTEVAADSQKPGTYQDFLDAVEALKYFITVRRNFLLRTYIHPQPGIFDMVMLKEFAMNQPAYCVGFDGRQFATLWFENVKGLDSMLVEAHPDSIYAGFDTVQTPKFVRRWLRIIPYPGSATFTMKLQWSYHDISSTEREVSPAVKDEHALQCFYRWNNEWRPLSGRLNPVSNTVTLDSVTERECGSQKCFMLFLPSE